MNFLRLNDPLLSVLFEDDDIIAIDKPYGYNAHTNDSKLAHSDFIQDGLIEIYEKNRGCKLHIIHRLDQTTTGVMIFGKSAASAKKYAEFFFNRQVKKTYLFITKYKSKQAQFFIEKSIIHKAKVLDAKTQLTLQKKSKNFELWKANPLTGRNHQIRIHAQEAQISILGDANYDGANFAFLCLHNSQIEFPNGILITSQPPIYFEDLTLLEDPNLARIYFEMDRRFRLYANRELSQQSFRLIHSNKDQNSLGYSLDHYGDTLVLHWQRENWSLADQTRFSNVAAALKKFLIVRFSEKNQIEISSTPAPSKWTVKENQMSFELRSIAGAATGLSTNQRLQRNWLLNNSKNKSVLNLFSNSGECSVAAALGHAAQVTSVETSKNMLAWSKNNFKLNQLDPGKYIFLGRDSLTFLDQCQKKNQKYDLIVCEAPTFLRREKGHFKIESDFEILLKSLFNCLNPDGEIIFSTYYEKFFIGTLANSIVKTHATVSATMKIQPIEISNILPGLDFELPDEKTNLISFLIRHIKLDQ